MDYDPQEIESPTDDRPLTKNEDHVLATLQKFNHTGRFSARSWTSVEIVQELRSNGVDIGIEDVWFSLGGLFSLGLVTVTDTGFKLGRREA